MRNTRGHWVTRVTKCFETISPSGFDERNFRWSKRASSKQTGVLWKYLKSHAHQILFCFVPVLRRRRSIEADSSDIIIDTAGGNDLIYFFLFFVVIFVCMDVFVEIIVVSDTYIRDIT